MKITAKLAYSQLKINRSRTRWTLLAIALSTSLTTAVCSFVASGNHMLVNFLGKDYGLYGGSYIVLLLIPAVIFGILVAAMSVTVISNVFRISAQERLTQFGIMKCTGATQKQITDTVMYESAWLCTIGIPVGLLLGLLLAFGGIQVANHYLGDLEALAHVMINEINLTLQFILSWQAVLVSAIFSFLIVLYSAWRPAHKAAKVSAIECIQGTQEINAKARQLRENRLVRRFFGFEGILADKNLKRNHRNFRATVASLSVGVILFVSLGGLQNQAAAIMDFMKPGNDATVISEYISGYSRKVNDKTGEIETIYLHPIDGAMGNYVTQRLEEFENTSILGIGNDGETYRTVLPRNLVSAKMQKAYQEEEESWGENASKEIGTTKDSYEFPVEIIILDQKNYEKLCEKAQVPVGSAILLNHYSYNDFGHKVNLQPFESSIGDIQLFKADGSTLDIAIQGSLTQDEIPSEFFYPNTNPVRLVVEDAMVRGFDWYGSPADIAGFMEYSNQVLAEVFKSTEDASYMEDGFSTRVYKMDEYIKVMNIAISLTSVFMYSFAGLLMLIGLTNVISTLSTNVRMRAKEFAVLKSVGMTPDGLRQMLNYESILCSLKALAYGVPVGIIVTILINLPIRTAFPIPYRLPWLSLFLCVLVVFFVTWGITRYAAHKLENQNLIESIRIESGR